jgi:predicted ArsR family transcriptional regulator
MRARRGRPLGSISQAVLTFVRREPATIPQLAARLQLSYGHAADTVKRLSAAGYVAYGAQVPGAHDRPARLVEPVRADAPSLLAAALNFPRWR